ncbi:phage tail protein [Xanthomonas rydalmerensis]|uniref:Tail fiber protein n=1 Tax=Xanthomonas rydalmerensis TaxID=3046274 RepID=A0ABZ0JL36_9XANT|nr:tail fiber protein [Xanthomonas sp. DM-2023]WOS40496.1 tail fiber protein [Xanthomonas sp. DM-2023]WOS44680.1 tail fiber protein [Xanthomonas sp. DM-2023]WOS48860.1 tail fiber protein [Xanthomonas sp. DM-2023]WOS53040.1 tail fiber protein [Xanthomonas sp. DM-2023]WOS57224.1 tail fiber protein [Xanthomonas sp. DM-2023]
MDAYTGQIILFASFFEPRNWAFCDGRSLPIKNYVALYSLIGTVYGGDGVTTFNLPDLRSRVPIGQGQGEARAPAPQLTARVLGQQLGAESVTLKLAEIPAHRHTLQATTATATTVVPVNNLLAAPPAPNVEYFTPSSTTQKELSLSADTVETAGANQAHPNRMPTQALNYLICLNGLFPNRP